MSSILTERTPAAGADRYALLRELERKVLWLSSWTIHNANHLRAKPDGLKVGGHQASCASLVTLMTALYLDVLRPEDRVAVKPHASPVFHAIQYLLGKQSRANLERFRGMGGAQSYPSRTKDSDDVDFSTGSVGLGVAMTAFASLVQDYIRAKPWHGGDPHETGRMIALVGDAELDEGNVFEALFEGWKHDVRNCWWVVDYNRQSLDAVVTDRLFGRFDQLFSNFGWRVEILKYGKRQQAVFELPGGDAVKKWIDDCPNSLYSALVFKGGAAWREHLRADIGNVAGVKAILDAHDDDALAALMTNLAGHDMESVLEGFHAVSDDQPTCFIAYTIKGFGLPFAGHKDNHSGLMNPEQMEALRARHAVPEGEEWEPFAGLAAPHATLREFLSAVPFAQSQSRRHRAPRISVPPSLDAPPARSASTQESFGRILARLARDGGELADHIVTTSPDVTVSTNLGGWVNRRGIFARHSQEDVFNKEKVASFQRWAAAPSGQHIELGIAEHNLFLLLGAAGLSHSLFGARLLPIGTLYDPFIQRGLDALNYACYQDARFLLVATPSGISLAPEGGAHQSITTPLIGIGQPGLAAFEPAFADELAVAMRWSFDYMQRDGETQADDDWLEDGAGGSVYLRLSTRSVDQPARVMDETLAAAVVAGGYWLHPPSPGATLAIVYTGVLAPEAMAAHAAALAQHPGAGLLAVTSADRLFKGWQAVGRARRGGRHDARCHVEDLLAMLSPDAHLVSVVDGHPGTLGWLGAVSGHRVHALGVDHFGQSGTIADLYRHHGLDAQAIGAACAAVREAIDAQPRSAQPHAQPTSADAASASPSRTPPRAPFELRIDAAALLDTLATLNRPADGVPAITLTHLLARIAARTLREAPLRGGDRASPGERRSDPVTVSIALADSPQRATPALRGVDGARLRDLASMIDDTASRASQATPADSARDVADLYLVASDPPDRTFAADVEESAHPAVLHTGPVDEAGTILCRLSLNAPLADDTSAAAWLQRFKSLAEDPRRLLL